METQTNDIYARVTDQIIAAMEAGAEGGRMPWHVTDSERFSPVNAASRKPYRGINVLALWAAAEARGYLTGLWGTYKQWRELGAQVRKGEKSSLVVFWNVTEADESEDAEGDEKGERRFFARGYPVFNAAQVDGYSPEPMPVLPEAERIGEAEAFFGALQADVRHGGNRACYRRETDHIQMPPFEVFRDAVAYYAVLAHEATHWTGAEQRLGRDLSGRFGSDAYAAEELVAELGAAFVCARLRLTVEPRADHAGYLGSWLRVLKNDKRAIFTAASKAQEAVDWMHDRNKPVAPSTCRAAVSPPLGADPASTGGPVSPSRSDREFPGET
jgi:antirestriction protein ArdC